MRKVEVPANTNHDRAPEIANKRPREMAAAVLPEKKVSLWAARSRQRCVGVQETENEDDQQQQQQLGPGMGVGMGPGPGMGPAPVATPVVPERAQAEALSTDRLENLIKTNSRYLVFDAIVCGVLCRGRILFQFENFVGGGRTVAPGRPQL